MMEMWNASMKENRHWRAIEDLTSSFEGIWGCEKIVEAMKSEVGRTMVQIVIITTSTNTLRERLQSNEVDHQDLAKMYNVAGKISHYLTERGVKWAFEE